MKPTVNNQIRQLLEKYYEGDTTLAEESLLQQYFTGEGEIDPDLLPVKRQFELFKPGREIAFDTVALENKIMDRISASEQPELPITRRLPVFRYLIAASIALIIGISAFMIFQSQNRKSPDTFTDPQLAYIETQKALLYISQKMNKGMKPLSNVSKINAGSEPLKNLGKLDESLGMLNLVSFVNQSSNLKK